MDGFVQSYVRLMGSRPIIFTGGTILAHGRTKISKEQARLLPNKTLPIPGDEDYYAVRLSVFHQLHCLVSSPPLLYTTGS